MEVSMKILSVRRGFASDHSSTSYEFLAVDKPLRKKEQAEVSRLSSRVNPTTRRANFIYHVDGYDIPGGWKKLMARYYDVMYSESYGWWMLAMAWKAIPGQFEELLPFEFEGATEGMGIDIENVEGRTIVTIHCAVERGMPYSAYKEYYDDEDEDEECDDESGMFATDDELLNALIQVRQQIIGGDYRALYAVWEKYGDINDENTPPKPEERKTGEQIVSNFKSMLGYIE